MKQENGYFIWNKGEVTPLSDHFGTQEFSCHCENKDCIEQRVSEDLINRLEWLRAASNGTLHINSGFRCEKYQQELEKSGANTVVAKNSQHCLGNAADIASSPLQPLQLLVLIKHKFNAYGIARNWIHVDLRLPHADGTDRTWKYY